MFVCFLPLISKEREEKVSKLKLGCIYFFIIRVFVLSGYMPRGEIAGSYANSSFSFLPEWLYQFTLKREIDSQT